MSLDKLPLEVQQHILNELDFKQLLLLRRTSRFFYSLIANGEVERPEALEMDLSHLYVAVDFSLEAKSVAAKARVLFTAKWHKISETTRIFARSRIIISSCDPLEVRVFAAASACQTPENTYPSYELYPDNVTLSKILAAGSSLDFMADGTIGFAPDDDYDRYLFSDRLTISPPDISSYLKMLSRRWNDIHSKAKQSHSISVSLPTPPYDM
ncbi:hypothetical protein BC829DRAFT_393917 [Chytridium lagenaria]|nr:hypothetical protein BC829DRAFT_393917 [Chytridium lagenaria]